ncbi:MAG: hypothetical protein JNL70_27255 [Saprospiraceae bacterium]|nr:hypothetical protein [Saprospiraceae bacterium]
MKNMSLFRLFIIPMLFCCVHTTFAQNIQNIQNPQNPQGIIRDEIIFLEGTTLPANAQTASHTQTIINGPPPFAVFNSSLNGISNRINAVKPNQQETKWQDRSIEWFRLPNKFDNTQEGYIIRIVAPNSGQTLCQFALGKANDRAKIYKNNETTIEYDQEHKIATLKVNSKAICLVKLEKEQFIIQLASSTQAPFDIFIKSGDKL